MKQNQKVGIGAMNDSCQCINFVLSSFARLYGVKEVKVNKKYYEFAKKWCSDNDQKCDIFLSNLENIDTYFKQLL
jgi:hypothetical protein